MDKSNLMIIQGQLVTDLKSNQHSIFQAKHQFMKKKREKKEGQKNEGREERRIMNRDK